MPSSMASSQGLNPHLPHFLHCRGFFTHWAVWEDQILMFSLINAFLAIPSEIPCLPNPLSKILSCQYTILLHDLLKEWMFPEKAILIYIRHYTWAKGRKMSKSQTASSRNLQPCRTKNKLKNYLDILLLLVLDHFSFIFVPSSVFQYLAKCSCLNNIYWMSKWLKSGFGQRTLGVTVCRAAESRIWQSN